MDPSLAFQIMEIARKGQQRKRDETWQEYMGKMRENKNIPDWFIDSLDKISYLFPKAHAIAYSMHAYRIAWYKLYYPLEHYATYFSVRAKDFDIETMKQGSSAIKDKIAEIKLKGFEATKKENDTLESLEIAYEMTLRGFGFKSLDLNKSDSTNFIIEGNDLIPSFITVEGLGITVAKNIIREREIKPFISIEDFSTRCKVSSTLVEKLKTMGIFEGLPETSQLSLFD